MLMLWQAIALIDEQLFWIRKDVFTANNFTEIFQERIVRFKLCGACSHGLI